VEKKRKGYATAGPWLSDMSKGSMDDDYLMGRLAMGDTSALAKLMAKYRAGLVGYFVNRANGCLDAEHLTGRVFDKVRRNATPYRPMGRFKRWLYSIAKNLLLDELKRAYRERHRIQHCKVTKYGSKGYHKTNHAGYDPGSSWNDADAYAASQLTGDCTSVVIDVNDWTRGVDITMRFRRPPKGYDLRKEIRAMFRRFGLVD
jgi:DNA-directed RNA polymerase specialized sigma24 family protein